MRQAYTPRHGPHDLAKERFVHAVANRVNEVSGADMFIELVVVAPSRVLNELLHTLDAPTKEKMIGNLAKDLVKTPDRELWPHVKEWVRTVHRA